MRSLQSLKLFAKDVSVLTLTISYRNKAGHIGSALSIADIVSVLYGSVLRINSKYLNDPRRDRFILSKGHAAASLYAALHKRGCISHKELFSFTQDEGGLCMHPEITTPGVDMTTGSLGHGLGVGAGMAWGLLKTYGTQKLELDTRSHVPHVYVLISDGECGEGSVWEAALFASRMNLENLTVLVDYNKWQCFGKSDEITHLQPFAKKWKSFGWDVLEVDGHDLTQLRAVLTTTQTKKHPRCIICHTISGKGVSCIENTLAGHYKVLNKGEYLKAKEEIMKGSHA